MAKFRKKPIVVYAEQFWPDTRPVPDGVTIFVAGPFHPSLKQGEFDFAVVNTLEGSMKVEPGDWVITGIEGEHYPCKDSIFRATYEAVDG